MRQYVCVGDTGGSRYDKNKPEDGLAYISLNRHSVGDYGIGKTRGHAALANKRGQRYGSMIFIGPNR